MLKERRLSFSRYNFDPVAIRIFNKINSHAWIFKADHAHFLMFTMGFFKVIRCKGEVELPFSQIIFFFSVFQFRQFQLKMPQVILQIDQLEAAVRRRMPARDVQAERLFRKIPASAACSAR